MKPKEQALVILLLCAGSLTALSSTIGWHTLDAGGGTVTGATYRISGTIGQPDAGPVMYGSSTRQQGGFWVLPAAIQAPGAPSVFIARDAPGHAKVWWFPPKPGFRLQVSEDLTSPAWTNAPSGITNPVVVPAVAPVKYYRVFRP